MKPHRKPTKPINVSEITKKAVEVILKTDKDHNVMAILLFGSHADGTAIWRSDIDICLVLQETPSMQQATQLRIGIAAELPDFVDIQIFNVLPQKIQKSIADNHKVIFKSASFDDFTFTLGTQKMFFESKRKMSALNV